MNAFVLYQNTAYRDGCQVFFTIFSPVFPPCIATPGGQSYNAYNRERTGGPGAERPEYAAFTKSGKGQAMAEDIKGFWKATAGKKVAFIGAGVSNRDLIPLFAKHGAAVTLCDKKDKTALGEQAGQYEKLGVAFSTGADYLQGLKGQDMIIRSPGFEYFTKELQDAKAAEAEVTSEMELFFRFCPCPIYAVTGSDGKTTTTTLVAKMLEAAGKTVHLGGNLGRALFPVVEQIEPTDVAVVELSSFQLISMSQSPAVALVTNVTPNHLDHHRDMQEYIDAKRNILLHQNGEGVAMLNQENDVTRGMAADVKGCLRWFSGLGPVPYGAFVREDGILCLATETGEVVPVVHRQEVKLRGAHNLHNLAAAMAMVMDAAEPKHMAEVARTFAGVEHRIEPVRTLHGVEWYNDSIATSPTRCIAGLLAFGQPIVLIAGGYDKGLSYAPLVPYLKENVKLLILMGATGPKIEAALREDAGYTGQNPPILHADSMEQAVQLAKENAAEGDIVSLSPASASFDLYPNFEKRGEHFKNIVNAL